MARERERCNSERCRQTKFKGGREFRDGVSNERRDRQNSEERRERCRWLSEGGREGERAGGGIQRE